jgi:hypothetical protein
MKYKQAQQQLSFPKISLYISGSIPLWLKRGGPPFRQFVVTARFQAIKEFIFTKHFIGAVESSRHEVSLDRQIQL